jgi:hypothetical protein
MRKFMTALHCPNFMSRGGMVLSPLNDKNKKEDETEKERKHDKCEAHN